MSEENQEIPVDTIDDANDESTEPEKKKSGRGIMTEKKLANLEKARIARAKNLAEKKKNPPKKTAKPKVQQKEEPDEDEVDKLVEKKALQMLKAKEQERELEELRKWKEATTAATKKKPVKRKPKKKVLQSDDEDDEEQSHQAKASKPKAKAQKQYLSQQEAPEMDASSYNFQESGTFTVRGRTFNISDFM